MNILDTTCNILALYESGQFNIEKWKDSFENIIMYDVDKVKSSFGAF